MNKNDITINYLHNGAIVLSYLMESTGQLITEQYQWYDLEEALSKFVALVGEPC